MEYFVYEFQTFMLIFSRIAGLIFSAIMYDSSSFPGQAKLGFIFFLTIVLFPMVNEYVVDIPKEPVLYAMAAVSEALIGVAIGLSITIAFSVFQLAGQFFTVQMGFGASEVFDPMSQISLPLMGQYLYIVFMLVFLALRGHVYVLQEIFVSFDLLSIDKLMNGTFLKSPYGLIATVGNLFLIGIRISIPIMGTLLLISISLGLLAKAAPQMNLLLIGFPISISVGFILLFILLPVMIEFISDYIDQVFARTWNLIMEISNG